MAQALQRVTTQFIPEEDRIRIAGVVEGGLPVIVWLTRRLLGLLLPVLIRRLDEEFASDSQLNHQIMQEFAQQAARYSFEPSTPVVASKESEVMLAISADVVRDEQGVTLVFRDNGESAYCLPLSNDVLRQWLHILHRADRNADWQLPQWPGWLTGYSAEHVGSLPAH